MVRQCSITTCRVEAHPSNGITCHAIPSKDEALKEKWIAAIPPGLIRNVTKTTYICSLHFPPENYRNTPLGRNCLKKDAIPSLFKAHKNSDEYISTRVISTDDQKGTFQICTEVDGTDEFTDIDIKEELIYPEACAKFEASTQTYPKHLNPERKIDELLRKVDNLQKQLKRRDARIKLLDDAVKTLKEEATRSESIREMLKKHFSDDRKLYLLFNEVNNNGIVPQRRQYSEEIKHLAVTIYFHSSKAYEHLQKYLCLPHPATIRKWMAKCESDEAESLKKIDQSVSQSIETQEEALELDEVDVEGSEFAEIDEKITQSAEIHEENYELDDEDEIDMEDLKIEVI